MFKIEEIPLDYLKPYEELFLKKKDFIYLLNKKLLFFYRLKNYEF